MFPVLTNFAKPVLFETAIAQAYTGYVKPFQEGVFVLLKILVRHF